MRVLISIIALLFAIPFYSQKDTISVSKAIPFATINGIPANMPIKMRKEQLKNALIAYKFNKAKYPEITVKEFSIKVPGIQAVNIKGNKIDDNMYQKIMRVASKGDKITIFDMKSNPTKGFLGVDPAFPIVIEIY